MQPAASQPSRFLLAAPLTCWPPATSCHAAEVAFMFNQVHKRDSTPSTRLNLQLAKDMLCLATAPPATHTPLQPHILSQPVLSVRRSGTGQTVCWSSLAAAARPWSMRWCGGWSGTAAACCCVRMWRRSWWRAGGRQVRPAEGCICGICCHVPSGAQRLLSYRSKMVPACIR